MKLGIYLTEARLRKLGPAPAQAIYDLIDAAPPCDGIVISLQLSSEQLAAIGADSKPSAERILMKTVNAFAAKKRGK